MPPAPDYLILKRRAQEADRIVMEGVVKANWIAGANAEWEIKTTGYVEETQAQRRYDSIRAADEAALNARRLRLSQMLQAEQAMHQQQLEDLEPNPAERKARMEARAAELKTSVHSGAIGAAASGKLTSKCVHGLEHNMTIATRKGGYHSVPHIHDAEQIHYIVRGDIKIYTPENGFDCREGDFNIVPRNMPHWAHVTSDDENILLQVHTPVLGSAANRKALVSPEEHVGPIPTVYNMTPWAAEEIMQVEEKFAGAMRQA